ncbi:MAG: Gfo/Idh/MocA family oxidoreductase [Lachnospiraceae bacterium]|nr:Gfo/Idh/MocA family oxidoreductase [Lachnospiraceae bacterium]
MKICMIGLGSIGTRHLKNLKKTLSARGITAEIDALRSTQRSLGSEIVNEISAMYHSFEDMPADYDIVFVTNPTSIHFETIRAVSGKTRHLFIEKPVFSETNVDLSELNLIKGNIYYVACPLRYKSVLRRLKEIIAGEWIFSVRAICSSYLPDWRKGVDYRMVYSAKKELGGGVVLDLIHEWDYLRWLFGDPLDISMLQGRFSDLTIDTDDLAVYLARYSDKVVELHLDYFGRKPQRKIELFCKDHTITVDIMSNRICWADSAGEGEEQLENNDFYLDEMNNFLDMVLLGTPNENSIEWAYDTLRIAKGELQKA